MSHGNFFFLCLEESFPAIDENIIVLFGSSNFFLWNLLRCSSYRDDCDDYFNVFVDGQEVTSTERIHLLVCHLDT